MAANVNNLKRKTIQLMTKDSVFHLRKELWDDIKDYKEDFKEVIQSREKNRIPFLHQSPQFAYREHLVKYLKGVCTNRKLSHCCLHLAVYILDIFMDNHSIVPDKVLIVANVCLLIAAKFEESATRIPKIADLNTAIQNRYAISDYKNLEVLVLRFFHWYVMFPTAAHYTHYYIQAAICMDDLRQNRDVRTLIFDLHNYIIIYLDKIVDDVHYMQFYPPSVLAAAVICASRMQTGLFGWTKELENLTNLTRTHIEQPLDKLMYAKEHTPCAKCLEKLSENTVIQP